MERQRERLFRFSEMDCVQSRMTMNDDIIRNGVRGY